MEKLKFLSIFKENGNDKYSIKLGTYNENKILSIEGDVKNIMFEAERDCTSIGLRNDFIIRAPKRLRMTIDIIID